MDSDNNFTKKVKRWWEVTGAFSIQREGKHRKGTTKPKNWRRAKRLERKRQKLERRAHRRG